MTHWEANDYKKEEEYYEKGNAVKAIEDYNRRYANKTFSTYNVNRGMHNTIELVTFELVEVHNEDNR